MTSSRIRSYSTTSPTDGRPAQTGQHQAADALDVLVFEIEIEVAAELVEPQRAGDAGRSVRVGQERRRRRHALVDFSDDFLEQVFERDDAGGAAVLVDDRGHVRLRPLHRLEHGVERGRFGTIGRRRSTALVMRSFWISRRSRSFTCSMPTMWSRSPS